MNQNQRGGIGDNLPPDAPDYAKMESERLSSDYAELGRTVDSLIEETDNLPTKITDDETKGRFAGLIKRLRDTVKRIEGYRELEKMPHYRRGQGVDQYFFSLEDRIARRDRKAKPGRADLLQEALTEYDTRKLREEQERRRVEAERKARAEQAAREEQERAERKARAEREAAERARKPEVVQAKNQEADRLDTAASSARIETDIAAAAAQEAHIETLAKPADIMRTRVADGTLTTMATEPYAIVVVGQDHLLDKEKLWPFISLDAKEKALRAWAKNTMHNQQMAGAEIGKRPKSVVR